MYLRFRVIPTILLTMSLCVVLLPAALRAQETNPYVRKGPIGKPGQTVDKSGPVVVSLRSRALQTWVGKKVLFMPHADRGPGQAECPGFEPVSENVLSDICDGKIGTVTSVGEEEYPEVIVEVDQKQYRTWAQAGTDKRPRVAGLLLIEEIDSVRKSWIGKTLWAKDTLGGYLDTYDPETKSYGSLVISRGQQLKVVDIVSSWAVNTSSPYRLILRTPGGAEGFRDVEPSQLQTLFRTSTPSRPKSAARAEPKPPEGDLQLLESNGKTTEVSTEIVGRVRNNTKLTYKYVQVTFQVYDGQDNQVGSAMANVNGLEPGGTWKFKAVCLCRGTRFKLNKITGF